MIVPLREKTLYVLGFFLGKKKHIQRGVFYQRDFALCLFVGRWLSLRAKRLSVFSGLFWGGKKPTQIGVFYQRDLALYLSIRGWLYLSVGGWVCLQKGSLYYQMILEKKTHRNRSLLPKRPPTLFVYVWMTLLICGWMSVPSQKGSLYYQVFLEKKPADIRLRDQSDLALDFSVCRWLYLSVGGWVSLREQASLYVLGSFFCWKPRTSRALWPKWPRILLLCVWMTLLICGWMSVSSRAVVPILSVFVGKRPTEIGLFYQRDLALYWSMGGWVYLRKKAPYFVRFLLKKTPVFVGFKTPVVVGFLKKPFGRALLL